MAFPFFEFTTSKDQFHNNEMHLTKHLKEGLDVAKVHVFIFHVKRKTEKKAMRKLQCVTLLPLLYES